jgi:putative lipoic acid-binding regulatory protein
MQSTYEFNAVDDVLLQQFSPNHTLSCVLSEQEYKDKKGQVFEDKLTFPCSFMIKIIGENEPSFVADTMGTVAEVLATQPAKVPMKLKETSGGKYVSVSITPKFETSAQIYSIYENLRKDPRVKFVV